LVEIISKKSENKPWIITLDEIRQPKNEQLRRISIDKFYEIVTGNKYAFSNLCKQLPITIEKLIKENKKLQVEDDSIFQELNQLDADILKSLYKLAFSTYEGF
ncbi:MAG: Eco47II family restriction endonuclease, partial [Methanobacteriaceae archaeon]|nr:Eco47II family restriction endonuclease [Methanobacteriaceae archaeon]